MSCGIVLLMCTTSGTRQLPNNDAFICGVKINCVFTELLHYTYTLNVTRIEQFSMSTKDIDELINSASASTTMQKVSIIVGRLLIIILYPLASNFLCILY